MSWGNDHFHEGYHHGGMRNLLEAASKQAPGPRHDFPSGRLPVMDVPTNPPGPPKLAE